MTHQPGLFDDPLPDSPPAALPEGPAPGRRCALFFALQLEADELARVGQEAQVLRASLGFDGDIGALAADRLHVSLHDLGEHTAVPAEQIARAMRAGQMVKAAPIALTFDRVMAQGARARKPLILMGAQQPALIALHQQLGMALADVGEPVRKSFTPHMTLAYVPRDLPMQAVPPLRWTAHQLSLIWSHVGETRYEYLARWPFKADQP